MANRQPYLLPIKNDLHYYLKTKEDNTFAWNTLLDIYIVQTISHLYLIECH